jgi:hypothetical protein
MTSLARVAAIAALFQLALTSRAQAAPFEVWLNAQIQALKLGPSQPAADSETVNEAVKVAAESTLDDPRIAPCKFIAPGTRTFDPPLSDRVHHHGHTAPFVRTPEHRGTFGRNNTGSGTTPASRRIDAPANPVRFTPATPGRSSPVGRCLAHHQPRL